MISLRLILLGVTILGTIGLAVYSSYQNSQQQQHYQQSYYYSRPPPSNPRLGRPSNWRRRRRQGLQPGEDNNPDSNSHSEVFDDAQVSTSEISSSPTPVENRSEQIESSCSICLSHKDMAFTQLCCGHSFHMKCIMPWLNQGKISCPNCRAKVV